MKVSLRRLGEELRSGFLQGGRGSWLYESMSGFYKSSSGKTVSPNTALTVPGVWACVRVPSEDMSKFPLVLYRRNGRGRDRATDHPLYRVLHDQPNPEMSSRDFKFVMELHVELRGNAFAQIVRENGYVTGLWPLYPDNMTITRDPSGGLVYMYRPMTGGTEMPLYPEDVFHLRGLTLDGIVGLSPVKMHRETIGGDMAVREYGNVLFAQGATPGGFLKHPGSLSEAAQTRLIQSFEKRHQGSGNAHKMSVLEEGMDFVKTGLTPEDAQFLESKRYAVEDLARIWRVPAHKVNDLDHATFSNIEQLNIEWVQDGIVPRALMWEQEVYRSCLTDLERKSLFAKFEVQSLLRGDVAARVSYYNSGRNGGWLSGNDIRDAEDLPPIDDPAMDEYFVPLNMQPVKLAVQPSADEELNDEDRAQPPGPRELRDLRRKTSAKMRRSLRASHVRMFHATLERVLKREKSDVMRKAEAVFGRRAVDPSTFDTWLVDYYREHKSWVDSQMAPLFYTYGSAVGDAAAEEVGLDDGDRDLAAFMRAYTTQYAARHVGYSLARIQTAVAGAQQRSRRDDQGDGEDDETLSALSDVFQAWLAKRTTDVSQEETTRAGDAAAIAMYQRAGVQELEWVATGRGCPYCADLNGTVVGIEEFFIPQGSSFQPDGADAPLETSTNVRHAPAHTGCQCTVVAA